MFDGWYTNISSGTKVDSSTRYLIAGSSTLYAHWTEEPEPPTPSTPKPWTTIKYKIKFETNGGTIAESYGEWKYQKGIAKTLPTSSQVSKSGYRFGGWFVKADFSGSA